MKIQEEIRSGKLQLIWSYILDYENSKNPYQERKDRIKSWRKYAVLDIQETSEVIGTANFLKEKGLQKIDCLHIACAILAKCEYFLSTDNKILRCAKSIDNIEINDPIGFIKEALS